MSKDKNATSEIILPHSGGGGTIQGHKNPLGSMLTWPHFQYTKADTDYKECYCTFHVSVQCLCLDFLKIPWELYSKYYHWIFLGLTNTKFYVFLTNKVEMCNSKIKIKLIIDKVHIFWEKSPINVKWNLEIRHIFVAFSEYMNFINSKLICHFLFTALVSKLDFLFDVYVVYILVYIPQWFLPVLSNPH